MMDHNLMVDHKLYNVDCPSDFVCFLSSLHVSFLVSTPVYIHVTVS